VSELQGWRRVVWVASIVLALAVITAVLLHYGVDWGIGGAP
jgi:preprotein translocase subunit SecG